MSPRHACAMARAQLIQLAEQDNVAVVTATVQPGTELLFHDGVITVRDYTPFGHKIAVRRILQSQKIVKYGVTIGTATADIEIGAHVHIHNLRSDYLQTFTYKGSDFTAAG